MKIKDVTPQRIRVFHVELTETEVEQLRSESQKLSEKFDRDSYSAVPVIFKLVHRLTGDIS